MNFTIFVFSALVRLRKIGSISLSYNLSLKTKAEMQFTRLSNRVFDGKVSCKKRNSISTMYLRFIILVSLHCLSLPCSSSNTYAEQPSELSHHSDSHIVSVQSLLPSTVCNRSPPVSRKATTLEVVNKYGSCSQLSQGKSSTPSLSQILLQDQYRVELIHSRRRNQSIKTQEEFTIPTISGNTVGTGGNYFIKVGLGTPKQSVSLVIDTGSGITWTQCKPCPKKGCAKQVDPIFDPSKSKSYKSIPCSSSFCSQINGGNCSSKKACPVSYHYVDGSSLFGSYATEKLVIDSADNQSQFTGPNFIMVCAHNFTGDDEGVVGIMGLDRNGLSIISQTSSFFKNYFSYCLPAFFGSSTGYITFGKTNSFTNKVINFTPLTTDSETYDVEITGLSLGGHKLPIDSQVFKKAGGTVDSGTVISHLPPAAYAPLKLAFRKKMSKYKMVKPSGFLDTCYDFSKYDTVTIPKMSIFFKGAVELKMDVTGIVIPFKDDLTEVCLAFSPNPTEDDGALIGNIQQQGMEVHYDVAGKRVGFGPRAC
ncbi:hypothetical protein Pint_12551 [Pistacia integerrima]|uniref:Uncharacterized protein n=1 Tax=Pistacia integerrima TaxID=434235 RepID=A0ACC0Y9U2_9ROSI|nr:hypothetical protein Pint_12551 [Pistacia integerrima]